MKYLSICSGIEAASVAWHPLDWKPVAFAEIEKFPNAVLKHHYPDVPNLGDIARHKEWKNVPAFDVLVGGTPCQSFSVAGLRKGMDDPRGNLALVYLAIADQYRPRWLVWENVPGVLSSNEGRDFGAFLGGLAKLGYGFAYRILDAQFTRVDGFGRAVPQRRRRVYVVGHLGDWRRAAAVLFERSCMSWDNPPRREAGAGIAEGAVSRALSRVGGGDDPGANKGAPLIYAPPIVPQAMSRKWSKGSSGPAGDEVANLVAQAFKPAHYTRGKDGAPSEVAYPLVKEADRGDTDQLIAFDSKRTPDSLEDVSPTLRSMNNANSTINGGGQIAVAFQPRIGRNGRGYEEEIAPALNGADAGTTSDMRPCVAIPPVADPISASEAGTYTHEGRGNFRLHNCVITGENNGQLDDGTLACAEDMPAGTMRDMREAKGRSSPHQRGLARQSAREPAEALSQLPHENASPEADLQHMRSAAQGAGILRSPLPADEEVGKPSARKSQSVQAGWQVRRLTPVECERLQGFPDNYTLIPYRGKPAADGPRYKALGNSFAVNVVRWLGMRIQMVEDAT